jgi:hypothetical protein
VGEAPPGWYCRYGPSINTRRLVVEHGGFVYDSDAYNDELPYYVAVAGKPHLVVPYTLAANDVKEQPLHMLRGDAEAARQIGLGTAGGAPGTVEFELCHGQRRQGDGRPTICRRSKSHVLVMAHHGVASPTLEIFDF